MFLNYVYNYVYKAVPPYFILRQLKPVHNSILCYFLNHVVYSPFSNACLPRSNINFAPCDVTNVYVAYLAKIKGKYFTVLGRMFSSAKICVSIITIRQ